MQYFVTLCSRPEAAIDMIYGRFMRQSIIHKAVKFDDTGLKKFDPKPAKTAFLTFLTIMINSSIMHFICDFGSFTLKVGVQCGTSLN